MTWIGDDSLDDFIARWEHAYGERLTRDQAPAIASQLLELYRVIGSPLPEERKEEGRNV